MTAYSNQIVVPFLGEIKNASTFLIHRFPMRRNLDVWVREELLAALKNFAFRTLVLNG